jgi:hypothetical protein
LRYVSKKSGFCQFFAAIWTGAHSVKFITEAKMRRYFHKWRVAVVATAVVIAFAGIAQSQTRSYSRTASSGKSQWIDAYFGWNNDCSFKTINVDVVTPPANGQVSPKVETRKITNAQIGATGNCLGKPTKAVAVYYRSKSGYRGVDRFKVKMTVGGSAPVFFNYSVVVR